MLTADRVRELLDYDAETGAFRWKCPRGRAPAGAFSGAQRPDGYRRIGIDGKRYLAHRIAWLWMTGEWPKEVIDHIGRKGRNRTENRGDNRWSNLRDISKALNGLNVNDPDRRSVSGYRNVTFCKRTGKWCTQVVGRFDSKEEAKAVADAMRAVMLQHVR